MSGYLTDVVQVSSTYSPSAQKFCTVGGASFFLALALATVCIFIFQHHRARHERWKIGSSNHASMQHDLDMFGALFVSLQYSLCRRGENLCRRGESVVSS